MPGAGPTPDGLEGWLEHARTVHPREIEPGLDRVRRAARAMGLTRPAPVVATVAGTNGKGSTVAAMEAALAADGIAAGACVSPHIHAFNERIRIGGRPLDDASICRAFAEVERARGKTTLTFFEFSTLAALLLFERRRVEVALLEVGLGGRLDAVNIVDADLCVITSIALDHEDWLGKGRERIGLEKAGVMRPSAPVVCGDPDPPASLVARARALGAPLAVLNRDFGFDRSGGKGRWRGRDRAANPLAIDGLDCPGLHPDNAAAAVQALKLLPRPPSDASLRRALAALRVPGRQEERIDRASGAKVLLDVAHNPAAAAWLARRLRGAAGRVLAVFAAMADKDVGAMAAALESRVDVWYIARSGTDRDMPVGEAADRVGERTRSPVWRCDGVGRAYGRACAEATARDLVVVTGSFFTVAAVRAMTRAPGGAAAFPDACGTGGFS